MISLVPWSQLDSKHEIELDRGFQFAAHRACISFRTMKFIAWHSDVMYARHINEGAESMGHTAGHTEALGFLCSLRDHLLLLRKLAERLCLRCGACNHTTHLCHGTHTQRLLADFVSMVAVVSNNGPAPS